MTTLSPTQARANLTSLLKRAAKGEDIGILHGEDVIALRPVKVYSEDYALKEYMVTGKEADDFVRRTKERVVRHRKAGKMTPFSGNIEKAIAR